MRSDDSENPDRPDNSDRPANLTGECNTPRKRVEMWIFEQQIPSVPDNCAGVMQVLLDELHNQGWHGRDMFGIQLVMEEALMNAIHHGNHCNPEKMVDLKIELTPFRFYAKITDEGEGFDPHQVPDPTLTENLQKTRGRGVMLIKNFVDSARYNKKGNSVELKKTNSGSQC